MSPGPLVGLVAAALGVLGLGLALVVRRPRARRAPTAPFAAWLGRAAPAGRLSPEVVADLAAILPRVPQALAFYRFVRAGREMDDSSFEVILRMAHEHACEGRDGTSRAP